MTTTTTTTTTFLDVKPAKAQAPSAITLPLGRQRQRSTRRRRVPPTSIPPSSTIIVKPEIEMPFIQDDPGAQSEELGDDSLLISYNPRTGRPIRQSAGKITRNPVYVDSSRVEDVEDVGDHEDDDVSSSDGDDTLVDDAMEPAFDPEEVARMKLPTKKRNRSPSPSPAVLSPEPSCEVTPLSSRPGSPLPGIMDLTSGNNSPSCISTSTFTINLNIPPGFSGLLPIQLTLPSCSAGHPYLKRKRSDADETAEGPFNRVIATGTETATSRTGFLSLSAELRNQIYRLVFVAPKEIHIARGQNVQRSAAFLRTCKQVYEEGRSILYSENVFEAERNKSIRTQMWNPSQSEYGYLQLHTWIGRMKPSTRAMVRNLRIDLDDALPSTTPRFTTEERRYVHEKHLIETFRLLGQDGKLRKITLAFGGRRNLQKTDHRFMKYLCAVKADYVEINHISGSSHYPSHHWHRITWQAEDEVKRGMIRKKKLYPVDTDSRKQKFATCKYCDGGSPW